MTEKGIRTSLHSRFPVKYSYSHSRSDYNFVKCRIRKKRLTTFVDRKQNRELLLSPISNLHESEAGNYD